MSPMHDNLTRFVNNSYSEPVEEKRQGYGHSLIQDRSEPTTHRGKPTPTRTIHHLGTIGKGKETLLPKFLDEDDDESGTVFGDPFSDDCLLLDSSAKLINNFLKLLTPAEENEEDLGKGCNENYCLTVNDGFNEDPIRRAESDKSNPEDSDSASEAGTEPFDDRSRFPLPCSVGRFILPLCCVDLRSSTNCISNEVARKMEAAGYGERKQCHSRDEDMKTVIVLPLLIKNHTIKIEFLISDGIGHPAGQMTLGRPFLTTAGAIIYMGRGTMDIHLGFTGKRFTLTMIKDRLPLDKDGNRMGDPEFRWLVGRSPAEPAGIDPTEESSEEDEESQYSENESWEELMLILTGFIELRKYADKFYAMEKDVKDSEKKTFSRCWRIKEEDDPGIDEPPDLRDVINPGRVVVDDGAGSSTGKTRSRDLNLNSVGAWTGKTNNFEVEGVTSPPTYGDPGDISTAYPRHSPSS